jgi:hypothetical protein
MFRGERPIQVQMVPNELDVAILIVVVFASGIIMSLMLL